MQKTINANRDLTSHDINFVRHVYDMFMMSLGKRIFSHEDAAKTLSYFKNYIRKI